jgi:hypothetical protein
MPDYLDGLTFHPGHQPGVLLDDPSVAEEYGLGMALQSSDCCQHEARWSQLSMRHWTAASRLLDVGWWYG